MRIGNWVQQWQRLTWDERFMVIEASCLLGIARATVLFIPFKRVAPHLGHAQQETPTGMPTVSATRVAHVIQLVSRHTPWDSNCFAQALTGHLMLRRRHSASTLYLGVHKQGNTFAAHAWLRHGDLVVTGAAGHERYTVVARYGWQPRDASKNSSSQSI